MNRIELDGWFAVSAGGAGLRKRSRHGLAASDAAASLWGLDAVSARLARVHAQSGALRIGVLSDMSGLYRDTGGPTIIACAQQAVEDSGHPQRGISVEIVSADRQNKADVGMSIARQWFDTGDVDAIVDVNNSSIALAINKLVADRNKVFVCTGAASTDLTGVGCSPNMTHWLTDTWADAHLMGDAVVRRGGDKWFFILANYLFGHLIHHQTESVVGAVEARSSAPPPIRSHQRRTFRLFWLRRRRVARTWWRSATPRAIS